MGKGSHCSIHCALLQSFILSLEVSVSALVSKRMKREGKGGEERGAEGKAKRMVDHFFVLVEFTVELRCPPFGGRQKRQGTLILSILCGLI